jgi:hypothetical protein
MLQLEKRPGADDIKMDIALLLSLAKNYANKSAPEAIKEVQNMPKIIGTLAGKVFIEVLEEEY